MKRRTMQHRWAGIAASALAVISLSAVTSLAGAGIAAAQTPTPLIGTFEISPGAYSATAGASGSYFRMLIPGGTLNGPDTNYVPNTSSSASDTTYTLLSPGVESGLVTASYQPAPDPAFDSSGNSLANDIVAPTPFESVNFSVETEATDPQTSTAVPTPSITNQYFNQGSPKPDGSSPGLTAGPTGTYNSTTGAYTFTWTSEIVGGPFNNFTGQWVLAGTFDPFYIKTSSLPSATPGSKYGPVTLKAKGAKKPYTWTVASGALPKGLKLSTSGVLSGKANKKLTSGTDSFTLEATSTGTPTETAYKFFDLTIT
jgi:hypothetical protein